MKTMLMIPVEAINILSIGYDQGLKILRIKFVKSTYEYHDVPSHIFNDLMSAPSQAKYIYSNIRDKYPRITHNNDQLQSFIQETVGF